MPVTQVDAPVFAFKYGQWCIYQNNLYFYVSKIPLKMGVSIMHSELLRQSHLVYKKNDLFVFKDRGDIDQNDQSKILELCKIANVINS
jgi:hypothetical protein